MIFSNIYGLFKLRRELTPGYLIDAIVELATRYSRYGYPGITGLLKNEGWRVNHKRVERIWRRERFEVLKKQPG